MNAARRTQPWGSKGGEIKPGSQREQWNAAIGEAMGLATPSASPLFPRAQSLARTMRGLRPEGFAIQAGNSGKLMAAAFLKACDALEIASGDQREEFAEVIASIARTLDRVMTAVRTAEADAVRARYGRDD